MKNADQFIQKASKHFLKGCIPNWVLEMETLASE